MRLYTNSAAFSAAVTLADGRSATLWLRQNEVLYDEVGCIWLISFRGDDGEVGNLLLHRPGVESRMVVELVKKHLVPLGLDFAGRKIRERYKDDPRLPSINLAVDAAKKWGPGVIGRIIDEIEDRLDPRTWCYYEMSTGERMLASPVFVPEPQEVADRREEVFGARLGGDQVGEARALSGLGVALWQAGRAEEAGAVLSTAATRLREQADDDGEGFALTALGVVCAELRRFDDAIGAYEQALAVLRRRGDEPGSPNPGQPQQCAA